MTREGIYNASYKALNTSHCLLLESATGTGKSKVSIDLVNNLCSTMYKGKKVRMLLLVYRTVHKITWRDEITKWHGLDVDVLDITCYASLHKYCNKHYDVVVADEVHHVGSELKLNLLKQLHFDYLIGLSATIPRKTKQYFKYKYHAECVSCDIVEAINDGILPEPEILLFPLEVENTRLSETIEVNAKSPGPIFQGEYKDLWKFKKTKQHAILKCTQRQKLNELNSLIDWEKKKYMQTRSPGMERSWLYHSGKRLEFLADCKLGIVKLILQKLKNCRTITFCKSIAQSEELGKWCIHSKKKDKALQYYDDFNAKKINHITAVNILNENANLVDCKYAIFTNFSSSETCMPQRLGRSMRHPHPVIIMPYYEGTREQEIMEKYLEGFNKDFIRTIHSIEEI